MGSAQLQGELWGARAKDWAFKAEPASEPFWRAILDSTDTGPKTKLLDLGCGGGGLLAIAAGRGAEVSGLDASQALVDIARTRVTQGKFRVGDLENVPFADESFDVVVACNSIQFADDQRDAVREAKRVLKPRGKFAIGMWCEMDRTDMRFLFGAVGSVAPPAAKDQPTLAMRENLVALVESGGFKVLDEQEVATPFTYTNADEAWAAFRSAGLIVGVIRAIGEEKLRDVVYPVIEGFRQADGSIRLENCFRYLVCSPVE
jgi:SAM-dependent methyltransferase